MYALRVHLEIARYGLRLFVLVFAILASLLLQLNKVTAEPVAHAWARPVVVDPGFGTVGYNSAIAIVAGNPAISYYDETNGVPKYIRSLNADGTEWAAPVVVDDAGGTPGSEGLAVVNGNPAISCVIFKDGGWVLKFLRASDALGTAWNEPVVIEGANVWGTATSLAVFAGRPAIAFYDQEGKPRFVHAKDADGKTWDAPILIDSEAQTSSMNLWTISMLSVQDKPAVAYSARTTSEWQLRFVQAVDASGTAWGTPATIEESNGVEFVSTAFVNGKPALSYNTSTGLLKYTRAVDENGAAWQPPVILEAQGPNTYFGRYNSLAVIAGQPAISYIDSNEGGLKYVHAVDTDGAAWAAPTTVDEKRGRSTSLIEVNGKPAIAYADAADVYDLFFVRATDTAGADWPTPDALDQGSGGAGASSSLAVVNGRPAIAYINDLYSGWISSELRYARSLDESGAQWAAPVIVDGAGYTGHYPNLAVIHGRPAVCYSSDQGLKYVQANDADGSSWGTPVIVDNAGGWGCNLLTIGNRPAIAYGGSSLKFVRALDEDGVSWAAPLVVDSEASGSLSAALLSGKPGICYVHSTSAAGSTRDFELRYVYASDVDGTNWTSPLTLDSLQTAGWPAEEGIGGPSLADVAGFPSIGYYRNAGGGNGVVRYLRAKDASGTTWNDYVTVAYNPGAAWDAALSVVDGKPAVGYLHSTDGRRGLLQYVSAKDAGGEEWDKAALVDAGAKRSDISMNVIAGRPAFSYHGSLRFVIAEQPHVYLPFCSN